MVCRRVVRKPEPVDVLLHMEHEANRLLIESFELFETLVSPEAKTDDTQIQKLAQRTLDDLESSYFTFRIGKQRIVVQEQVKKILELLTTFKSVIGAAAAAEPSASLAWTGIMAALPVSNTFCPEHLA